MITILYTTDTLGYMEPCGCGGRNIGGLAKRASYIKSVLIANPNSVILESGNLAYRSVLGQPTAQLEVVAQALKHMGYTATGVGSIDIAHEKDFYDVLKRNALPVVHIDEEDHNWAQPYIIKNVNGVRVGIISFGAVDPENKDKLSLFKRRYKAFKEARQMSDVLIVLDQAGLITDDWLSRNAARLGSPDIVVMENSDKNQADSRWVGGVLFVPACKQGRTVGRVDIEIANDGKKMAFSRTTMDEKISDDPEVLEMVKSYTAEQRRLAQLQIISNSNVEQSVVSNPRTTAAHIETGGAYYNYETCAGCHESECSQWKQTRHAKALDTLVTADKTIADCLPCHSEMYRRTTSVVTDPTLMLGVECASCHYDVLPHGADFKKKGNAKIAKARCSGCHTPERSPDFDPAAAYDKMKHRR